MSSIGDFLPKGSLSDILKRYADVALAFLVISVIALLIVPIPTWLLDLFLCFNISIAIIMLLVGLYITNILKLSSFPTILLITTLFRLGLNVAATRLILLHADAGEVIEAFGSYAVGGNFIVGIVIFLVLMIINMLVISKGSERVAEVAARFTLDAMPGKQMSIDADLRSGILDMDQARKKRQDLSRESQLFGAMDGAMKFVKGDVIAGVIIFAINIVAGITIGITQKGMSADEAIETYAILSIGDGLISIIPGLLMSVCAGIIVTRVGGEEEDSNLGQDLASQVMAHPKAFAIAAAFIGLIGQIPGLPRIPFTAISLGVGVLAFGLFRSQNQGEDGVPAMLNARDEKMSAEKGQALQKAKAQEGQSNKMMPVVTPIGLEVASDLIPLVDDTSNFLGDLIPTMRDGLFYETGIRFPGIRVRGNDVDETLSMYTILINEIPMAVSTLDQERVLVNDTPDRLELLGIQAEPTTNPANGLACSLIPASSASLAEQAGLVCWEPASFMILHMSAVLRKNASDFVGIQEAQNMLDQLDQAYPALVKEVIPKAVTVFQFTDILKRLSEEGISIRDLRTILQTLAEWGPVESDTVLLTEHTRVALKRYISHKYAAGSDTLVVYLLDPQIEETVRSSIQQTSSGSYLALEPEITQEILDAIRNEIQSVPSGAQQPILLTTQDIRRYVHKLVEIEFPHVAILSYQELSQDINVQPMARITLG